MSNTTEIIFILDRSSSMGIIRDATVKGINDFIKSVQEVPGEGFWTCVQFDDHDSARGASEEFPLTVFSRKSDAEIRPMTLDEFRPRGGTALVDAVCITVMNARDRWLALPEDQRPRMLVQIVTDGEENASRFYTTKQMRELMGEVQGKYGWKVDYLGANQDAFAEADKYGIEEKTSGGISNRMNYSHDATGMVGVMRLASAGTRNWKAEGNQSAVQMLSSAEPDKAV